MSILLSANPTTTATNTATSEITSVGPPSHGYSDADRSSPSAVATYQEVVQNEEIFMETLKDLHKLLGTKFTVPIIGGKALDLHRLFVEVTSRGGLEKVIRDRKWREVIMAFNFPTTITNASFVLRKYYLSLLYNYEQVYYFRKQGPPISTVASPTLQPGCWVNGTIDGKFDNGYIVTVSFGSDELKGVLYHVPIESETSQSTNAHVTPSRHSRKRSRLALRDPLRPKPNRSGYNFFFAEHYARLKPLYHGQEKAISKKIGLLWSKLTEVEKQVYQDKGLRDKERYQTEMLEYRKSSSVSKTQ